MKIFIKIKIVLMTEVPGQNRPTSILSKLPTTACWFRKNVGKDTKLAINNSKCASFVEATHSTVKSKDSLYFHTSSSPVEANNSKSANHSTVKSKDSFYFHTSSLPVMANNSKSVQFVADNSTVESCSLSVNVSVEAKKLKTFQSFVEANYATVKSDDCFTLKSNDSLHFHASSLPVEAMPFEPADSTVESCPLSVEAKELLTKIGSLVDVKYSPVKSNFETKSDVKIIYSNVDSKCLSTVEEKENIKSAASSCCLVINDEQFGLSREDKLDCDVYRINYGERRQVLVNSDNTCDPHLTLCLALMETFTTFKDAIVILRNVSVAIFCEPNGSFYTFEPMPHYIGRETVLKFSYI